MVTTVLVEVLRFKEENSPALLITQSKPNSKLADDLIKFKKENVKLTKEEIENFIINWKNGKLPHFLASEEIPENPIDDKGIHKIVGLSFDNFITTQDKDLVLAICSKLANRCIKFEERYNRTALRFKGNKQIVFATTDPNYNEYIVDIPAMFPSIYFFPAENYNLNVTERFEQKIVFKDYFTTENITKFIVVNSRNNMSLLPLVNETDILLSELADPIFSSVETDDSDFNFDEFMKGELGRNLQKGVGNGFDLSDLFQSVGNEVKSGDDNQMENEDDSGDLEGDVHENENEDSNDISHEEELEYVHPDEIVQNSEEKIKYDL
jgi:hypothetical protein